MAAIAQSMVSNILNATLPTHGSSAGFPSVWTALSGAQMKLRLNSTASSAATAGTELTGGAGYVTGGSAFTTSSTASSSGSNVTLPAMSSGFSWTNTGSTWSIVSLDITDGSGTRAWYGTFNGQPISVANGNTFQVAQNAITVVLT